MSHDSKLLSEKMNDGEMILIGIGEEFSIKYWDIEKTQLYKKVANDLETHDIKNTNYFPYIIYDYLKNEHINNEHIANILQGYNILARRCKDKDFFIITTNIDDMIWKSHIDKDRIVAPCGGYHDLQCSDRCSRELINSSIICEEFIGQIRKADTCINVRFPTCPKCGSELVFNNILMDNYIEDGYLSQWEKYTRWLQGTLNKRICILELGVGISYPTVIRWPFEKIGYYNQKSSYFRINEKLYQLTEELKEKGISIPENALDFMVNKFV